MNKNSYAIKAKVIMCFFFFFLASLAEGYFLYTYGNDIYMTPVRIRKFVVQLLVFSLLIIAMPRKLSFIVLFIQFVLNVFIVSYINSLQTQPIATAIINGFYLVRDMLPDLISFVPLDMFFVFFAILCVKILAFMAKEFSLKKYRLPLAILSCVILVVMQSVSIYKVTHLRKATKENNILEPAVDVLPHVGYVATWAFEVATKRYEAERRLGPPVTCCDDAVRTLPLVALGNTFVLMQVESLNYDALFARVDGIPVAPTLEKLAREGFLLRLDGEKRLASANSDYELLNGYIVEP